MKHALATTFINVDPLAKSYFGLSADSSLSASQREEFFNLLTFPSRYRELMLSSATITFDSSSDLVVIPKVSCH